MDRPTTKKLPLVIKDRSIQEAVPFHDFVIHCARHQNETGVLIPATQGAEQRHYAQHVAELIVLTDDEDGAEVVRRGRRVFGYEKPEDSYCRPLRRSIECPGQGQEGGVVDVSLFLSCGGVISSKSASSTSEKSPWRRGFGAGRFPVDGPETIMISPRSTRQRI